LTRPAGDTGRAEGRRRKAAASGNAGPQKGWLSMKVQYIGETKQFQTISGKDVAITRNAEYECMEKEYHSATTVRVLLADGEHVKIKRGELKKA
jgi:hypothetical protein